MHKIAQVLESFGFTGHEVTIYLAALQHGPQTVLELSRVTKLPRRTIYLAIESLTRRGLITETARGKKRLHAAQPPEKLIVHLQRQQVEAQERIHELEAAIPALHAEYQRHTERPIVRFFEGVEGLKKMYQDKIDSGAKELYFIRTAKADTYWETFGPWFREYLKRQAMYGIRAYALSVDDTETNHDPAVDAARRITRTWLRPQDYTAPVQIDAYGERVAILCFGKEVFGLIIENQALATAVREIFQLAERGAKTVPVTHDHPPLQWKVRA